MKEGKLIVFEGPSGVGKTTLAKSVFYHFYDKLNGECVYSHNQSDLKILGEKSGLSAALQYLSDIKDLADGYEPYRINGNYLVMLDRYVQSTYVHQFPDMSPNERRQTSYLINNLFPKPDLTIYIRPNSLNSLMSRLAKRGKTHPIDMKAIVEGYEEVIDAPFGTPAFIVYGNSPTLMEDVCREIKRTLNS